VFLKIHCERCSDLGTNVRRGEWLEVKERSSRFGADNIPERCEMVTRKLRVTNYWPGLIAALTILGTVVSYRFRSVSLWAVKGRAELPFRSRLRPGFSQLPYQSATRVAREKPRWQEVCSPCFARLAGKLRSQRDPNCRSDTKSLLGIDLRSGFCMLTVTSQPRRRVPGCLIEPLTASVPFRARSSWEPCSPMIRSGLDGALAGQ
jgi:hypothetical protein